LAADGETSWHGYAKYVIATVQAAQSANKIISTGVDAIPTSAFPTPARRPLNSRLDTAKLQAAFGLSLPPWQRGVARMVTEIL
jgi:dTDP-4-dehydrorhamnose reductase